MPIQIPVALKSDMIIAFRAAWKRYVNFNGRAIGIYSRTINNVQELPEKPGADKATGLFVWIWMPPAAGTAGVAARKEVTMSTTSWFTLLLIVVRIVCMFIKESEVPMTTTDSDVIHPAEFEMRDHYFTRCSE